MASQRSIFRVAIAAIGLLVAVRAWTQDAPTPIANDGDMQGTTASSGSGTITLSPLASEPGSDAKWQVQIQDTTGSGGTVTGTVSVGGVPIGRPDNLGAVSWQLSGNQLSGTVSSANGGATLASFTGTVAASGVQGTFTTVTGDKGTWTWTGSAQ